MLTRLLALLVALGLATPSALAQPADGPSIRLGYPAADVKTDKDGVALVALVSDDAGVKSVQVTVNGDPVTLRTNPDPNTPPPSFHVNTRVPLTMGRNQIVLTVTNTAGKSTQVTRTVTRVSPEPVAAPPAPAPAAPARKAVERYAVVIGVGEHEHKSIPPARFAARDAQAMYDFLTTTGGFKKENVQLVSDGAPAKPTFLGISQALGAWLIRRATKDDFVLVYFAGRGTSETDATGRARDGLAKYLVTYDTDPEAIFSTAFALSRLEDVFARLKSDRVVFLVDADWSGNASGRSYSRQTTRSAGPSAEFMERLTQMTGRVFITASGSNESALEPLVLKHGLFTFYVLEGLAGGADRDRDGVVTLSELYAYVQGSVVDHARRLGARQSPVMQGVLTELPLIELPKR